MKAFESNTWGDAPGVRQVTALRRLWISSAVLVTLVVASCHSGDHLEPQPPVPAQLAFAAAPPSATSGVLITPAIQVLILDSLGKTVTDAFNSVTMTLGANLTGATLSGTTTVLAADGVAIFKDLVITGPVGSYALTATSGSLTTAKSASFGLTAPPSLHVVVATTGASIPNTFTLNVDCDYYYYYDCVYSAPISPNGAVTIPANDGAHSVQLSGVPDNCTTSGDTLRTVTVAGPTDVPFAITCAATGSLTITTATGGTDINPDPYAVCVDRSGNSCYWHAKARANDVVNISGITAGPHTVTLNGVGNNCAAASGSSLAVAVTGNANVNAPFNLTCSLVERIAFVSNGTITFAHIDGTNPQIVAPGFAPAWSPDGTKLAYECNQDICTINADGTGRIALTINAAGNRHPAWSPDGLKIAFGSAVAGSADLYVLPATGGAAQRLTQGVGVIGNPAWSPDGTQIAFDCQVDAGNFDICVVRADGTGFARLTNDPGVDYGAAWKPDGSTLAFATSRFGSEEVVLMSAAGGSVTRIGAGLPGFAPTWSLDGTQIAFVQLGNDPVSGNYSTVLAARVDGSGSHTVTRGAQPVWRPHR